MQSGLVSAAGYLEGQVGAINNPQAVLGMRGGATTGAWDLSAGYWSTYNASIDEPALNSNRMDLHTFDVELYKLVPTSKYSGIRLGAGLGYTMPNLGGTDKADNDISYIAGAGFDYKLTRVITLGLLVRGFFFNTDTRRTNYGSHTETLSNGQAVEVVDVTHSQDSVNFNSVLVNVGIKYYFE